MREVTSFFQVLAHRLKLVRNADILDALDVSMRKNDTSMFMDCGLKLISRPISLGKHRHQEVMRFLMRLPLDLLKFLDESREKSRGSDFGAAVMLATDLRSAEVSIPRIDEGFDLYGRRYIYMLRSVAVTQTGGDHVFEVASKLIAKYNESRLIRKHSQKLIQVLHRGGRFSEVLQYIQALDGLSSPNISLHKLYVKSLHSLGRYQDAQNFLVDMERVYSPDSYFELLLNLGDRAIAEVQVEWMNSYVYNKKIEKNQLMRAMPCLNKYGSFDSSRIKSKNSLDVGALDALELDIALSENKQLKLLMSSELGGRWSLIQAEAEMQALRYLECSKRATLVENGLFERQNELFKLSNAAHMLTETAFSDAYAIADILNKRILEGKPTSMVRIGDGEAAFLASSPLNDPQREKMISIWWGNVRLLQEEKIKLKSLIDESVKNADVIGVAPPWRIFDTVRYSSEAKSMHMKLFSDALERIFQLRHDTLDRITFTSAHFHQAALKWDLLPTLLNGVSEVSVIAPHDLSEELLVRLGVRVRLQYRTPPEHRFSDRFSTETNSERMYPERLKSIIDELDVKPGEVVLIAAGFVGKYLCKVVKDRGGIGLDMGSIADYLIGHETRVYSTRDNYIDTRPHTFSDQKFSNRRLSHTWNSAGSRLGSCYSDVSGVRDILPDLRNTYFEDRTIEDMSSRLLVTGHPRCASGFIASFMSECNVKLGHERFARDGICCWMRACSDIASPWGDLRHPNETFPNVLGYARDPVMAMPSIALENCQARSFRYRRFNIFRSFGVDIVDFETPLARAVASYVYWYKQVISLSPAGFIRVENAAEDLVRMADFIGSTCENFDVSIVPSVNIANLKRNDSQSKFIIKKPSFNDEDWANVPDDLMDELKGVCELIGYERSIEDLINRL